VVETASTSWCVVRTQGGQTLTLAKSLQDAGFAAWTPTETVTRRARRSHPAQDIVQPLMPGLIFVAWDKLDALIALSRNAMPYSTFSGFSSFGLGPVELKSLLLNSMRFSKAFLSLGS
jgi:hypothetical protein